MSLPTTGTRSTLSGVSIPWPSTEVPEGELSAQQYNRRGLGAESWAATSPSAPQRPSPEQGCSFWMGSWKVLPPLCWGLRRPMRDFSVGHAPLGDPDEHPLPFQEETDKSAKEAQLPAPRTSAGARRSQSVLQASGRLCTGFIRMRPAVGP